MFFSSCLQQSLHLRVSCDYISFQIQLTASFDARFLISQDLPKTTMINLLSWRFSSFRLVCSIPSHSKRRPNLWRAGLVMLWLRVCNACLKINVLNTLGMSNLSPNHKPRCESMWVPTSIFKARALYDRPWHKICGFHYDSGFSLRCGKGGI